MKVLSLLQPWASLVIMGAKKIETRSWQTAHRGELLIHASLGKKGSILAQQPPFNKYIKEFTQLPFGAIIGSVVLYKIVRVEELQLSTQAIDALTLEERAFGDYSKGRYAWLFTDAVAFDEALPIRGALSLWNYNIQAEK